MPRERSETTYKSECTGSETLYTFHSYQKSLLQV
jgi:hypothetical protein